MKVGDLFVSLGIKSDKRSFDKARDDLGRFTKQADSKFAKLGKTMSRGLTGGISGARGRINSQLGAAGVGAAFMLAARDALKFDESLNRLDISSRGAMGSMDKVREKVLAVSRATGVSKEELVAGSAAFVALTGDGKMAAEAMETFAKVQKATGAPMEDIVGSAAALNEQLGITGSQFERVFSILIAGGKAGKIELKDMAALTASLAAGYKQFGASQGLSGAATLGSAFQVVAQNFGSASEAATGLEALMGSIQQNAEELRKDHGIDIYEEDGKTLRSLEAITQDIGARELNATKVLGLLKRKEAVKTFNALNDNRKQWEQIREETARANDVAEDYAKFQASQAAQASKSWNEVKLKIAEAFSPERLEAVVTAIGNMVTGAGWLVEKFGDAAAWMDRMAGADEDLASAAVRKAAETQALARGASPADAVKAGNEAVRRKGGMQINRGRAEEDQGAFMGSITSLDDWRSTGRQLLGMGDRFLVGDGLIQAANRAFLPNAPTLPAGASAARGGVQVSAPVTLSIQAPSGDAKSIAGVIRRELAAHRDALARELDAATGGE